MVRGLVLGALAFGAVFAAERQLGAIEEDVARYDAIRRMSGDPPFFREMLQHGLNWISELGSARQGEVGNVLVGIAQDVLRYATLRSM